MSWSDILRLSVVGALCLVLSGCGFQLRGPVRIPDGAGPVHIQAEDTYSDFYRELVSVFRQGRVELTTDPTKARMILRVLDDETGRRLLSVTPRNIPAEYEVYYRIRIAVIREGREVLPPEQLVLARDYTFDATQVLGKSAEEQVLRRAIVADLVNLVMRRLVALG